MAGEDMQRNVIWNALSMHKTQNAVSHAGRIINSDAVFFERRTDNLLYRADICVSSGEKKYINDFMMINVRDVLKRKLVYGDYLWIPDRDDRHKSIFMKFVSPTLCNKIVCYQNTDKKHRIWRARISFDNGYVEEWDMAGESAIRMEKCFPEIRAEWIRFQVTESAGAKAGVSELELYYDRQEPVYDFIKIMNKGNFIYQRNYFKSPDYQVYGYCRCFGSRLLEKEDYIETVYINKAGQEILRAALKGHEEVYDEIVLYRVTKCQMCRDSIRSKMYLCFSHIVDIWNYLCTNWSKCKMLWQFLRKQGRG